MYASASLLRPRMEALFIPEIPSKKSCIAEAYLLLLALLLFVFFLLLAFFLLLVFCHDLLLVLC